MGRLRSFTIASLAHATTVLDQGLSSLSSLLSVLAVARAVDASDFGTFALGYTGLTLFLGLSRAFFGMPLSISARDGRASLKNLYTQSMSAACLLFIPIAGLVIAIGAFGTFLSGNAGVGWMAVAVGIATPLVMLQDIARFFAAVSGRPHVAVGSDAIWLCGMGILFFIGGALDEVWFSVSWLGVLVSSLLAMMVCVPWRTSVRGGLAVLKPRLGLRESVAGTAFLSSGTTLIVGFLITPFFGTGAVGSLRGAGTLFGPVNTMISFLDFGVLNHVAKRPRASDGSSLRIVTLGLVLVEIAWAAFLLLAPPEFGQLVLGETWSGTRAILPVTGIEYFFLCITAGMTLILKARGESRRLILNKILSTAMILVGTAIAVGIATQFVAIPIIIAFAAVVGSIAMALSVRSSFRERFHAPTQ